MCWSMGQLLTSLTINVALRIGWLMHNIWKKLGYENCKVPTRCHRDCGNWFWILLMW